MLWRAQCPLEIPGNFTLSTRRSVGALASMKPRSSISSRAMGVRKFQLSVAAKHHARSARNNALRWPDKHAPQPTHFPLVAAW